MHDKSIAKISIVVPRRSFKIALWISSYYYASLGVVLQIMLRPLGIKSTSPPKADQPRAEKKIPALTISDSQKPKNPTATFIAELGRPGLPSKEQILPPGRQTLVLVPERKDIELYEKKLRKIYPAADVRTYHTSMKISEQRAIAHDALADIPFTIIGTRSAPCLSLPSPVCIL